LRPIFLTEEFSMRRLFLVLVSAAIVSGAFSSDAQARCHKRRTRCGNPQVLIYQSMTSPGACRACR
jgi:hypothetical protein